ncbi:acetyltransferase domain-containing protein [Xylaria intraflava]|nr:acetyltransferase domain-containing protein [Xylaria intraflava]
MASDGPNTTLVPVLTTYPYTPLPPLRQRSGIQTKRLRLRPLVSSDLEAYHKLRKQPEFMAESSSGRPDKDINETKAALDNLISAPQSQEHFLFGIFHAATGELIGEGGIHTTRGSSGWPEMGYKLGPEYWGQGYTTEAMAAVIEAWWALRRDPGTVAMSVHLDSVALGKSIAPEVGEEIRARWPDAVPCRELLVAEIAAYNAASRRVLEKLGFKHFGTWEEPDTQIHRLGQPLLLEHYALARPKPEPETVPVEKEVV